MKRLLLLTTIGVLCSVVLSRAQNVFNPTDPIIRYNANAQLGTEQRPNPGILGLQKWVSTSTSGVSFGSNSFDASSFKAYFMNLNGAQLPFRLKFPKSFTNGDSANKKYPVMIFFHGAGEPGCPSNNGVYNNEKQLLHGGRLFRDRVDNNEFDGFLLYPQLVSNNCWGQWGQYSPWYAVVIAILDSLAEHARLDVDKVLVTGLSDGGGAAWFMATAYPQRVTHAAPSASATGETNYADFVHIPIWFASGGKDTNPNPGAASGAYNGVKNAGGDITWSFFSDLGHSVWYEHWQQPGFVDYMNSMHKANPLVYFQRYDFCPDSAINTKIGITRGFYQYEWQRDGVTIATATRTGANTYSQSIQQPAHVISYTANDITVRSYGTYRVRFRRNQGDNWSEWSPRPAVIYPKTVTQTPPIVVKGLNSKVLPAPNGATTAPLGLPSGFSGYQWYRNDVLVGSDSVIDAIPGVYKAKVLEQFGCGSFFSPNFTVVSANGEPKPDPATNLTATIESLVNIRLNWQQNPNAGQNESNFEVYRSAGSGGPYTLLAVLPADVSTYVDEGLPSNSSFYYIVRAVGEFGAAASTNEATAHTPLDQVAPSAPKGLETVCITRDKVTLRWQPATDNVGVAVYDIYINGEKAYSTPNTRFEIYQLNPLTNYAFSVKAKDPTGNESQPSNQVTAYTRAQGLCYKVYEGTWEKLPDFGAMVPVAEGMAPNVNLNVRPAGLNDNFGMLWEGHIFRTGNTSTHRFRICSDDGSRFYWNGYYNSNSTGHINNDDLHGNECVTAGSNVSLSSNTAYPFALAYFEQGGSEALELRWRIGSSGSNYQLMPNSAFTQNSSPSLNLPAAPSGLSANAASYHTINLSWNDNSNNETGFEVVRSLTQNGTYDPIATVTGNSYSDTGLDASTIYYYRVRSINNDGQSNFTAAVSATTQAPPPPPAAPTNLVAQVPALQTIQLTWNDNSNDETAFEVWRSIGNNTEYVLLATVEGGAGSEKVYVDAPVFANVNYFYKVRAAGNPTFSEYTIEVSASTPNTAPVLNPVPDFTVRQGTSITVPISATDVDGDPLEFSSPNMPKFAAIETVSNGNANLVVNAPAGKLGTYNIRLIVSDGAGGTDTVRYTMILNNNSTPVLGPISDVTVNEGDSVVVALSATDDANSQYMVWSFSNKPSFATFTDSGNGKGSLKFKPGYAASGIYNMTVKVDDGFGAWTTRTFNVIVNETDPNETIQINFRYWSGYQPLWNDVPVVQDQSFNVGNLINKKGQQTTVGINLVSNPSNVSASDAGMQPAGNTGVFPNPIMKDQLQFGYLDGTDQAQIRVRGLDPHRKYNFIFFASVNGNEGWRGYNANSVTTYTINGVSAQVRMYLNTNETDTIYQVQPGASGEVFINITGDPSPNIGALLNAMIIESQVDDGTTPIKPANVTTQVVTNVGVRLTWQDIAYNEYSYKIYRATSPEGPYTEISSAAKDSTNYLDQDVAPYTHYYYFLRGVNNHGLGESSDTVLAVTGNNKPIISGLSDLYVKTDASVQDDFSVSDNPGEVITVTILNKPSFLTLTGLGDNNYRITASPNANHIGSYYLTLQVTDDKGGLVTQAFKVQVADKNTRSVFVNFAYNWPVAAPWNNVIGWGNNGTTLNNLRDETNATTPFGLQLMQGWDGVTDMGHMTGNNSGVFPDSVLMTGLWDFGTTQDGTNTFPIRFFGLNNAKRYNIVLTGSQNEGISAAMRFASGSVSDTLNARFNTNQTANLNGLTPSNGEITVNITKLNGTYMFLNAIQIEEYDPMTTLMSPANLYVEPRTDRTSVALSWSDRSNGETGFQLQRSTDSLFSANVQNINLSAGASSYINTGLQPNTKYWYRVRANAGGGNFSEWSNVVKTITPGSIVYVNFNFSVADGPSPWNNTNALPNFQNTFSGLLNHAGQPSGMSLAIEKIFNGEYAFGLRTGNNSGVVPDNVMEASYWIDRGQVATVRLSGLNQSKRYRIGFTGGIDNTLFSGDMTMTYTIGNRTVYLNSYMNTTKMVYIGDIVPDQNGEVLITFSTPDKTSIVYGFTSAIIVQSYDDVAGGSVPNVVQPVGQFEEVVHQNPSVETPQVALQAGDITSRMYPNPFKDLINLDFNNTSATNDIAVDIFDLSGKLVYRRTFGKMAAGYTTLRVNASEGKLNKGVYLVTLMVNGKPVQAMKMIKGE